MPIESDPRSTQPEYTAQPASPVIIFEGVSVRYRVPRERVSGLKEFSIRWLQGRMEYDEFWALNDVSFQVMPGEIFGIIGRNGAGKSTLLKVMAKVLKPTRGRVVMVGRVAPLLELGGGFHPELVGRENVYLNMALLGHSRQQTDELFDSIVEFAEIKDFINAPLRTYSTGMVARLGFAVATCLRPDILLVDEVLSVGDSQFQEKCLERMYTFQRQGTTIVIVSHAMAAIETFCHKALWLDGGRVRAAGAVEEVINQYMQMQKGPGATPTTFAAAEIPRHDDAQEPRWASLPPWVDDYLPLGEAGNVYPAEKALNVQQGTVSVWVKFTSQDPGQVGAIFHTDDSRYVLYSTTQSVGFDRRELRKIVARAGGNHRAFDTFYGVSEFPEAWILVDTEKRPGRVSLAIGTWHLVVMTWLGYPRGTVRLYINGELVSEKAYDPSHDRGDPLPTSFSVGMRPSTWTGELVRKEDGSLVDIRPQSLMSIDEANLEIKDLRLYRRALTIEEISALYRQGEPLASPDSQSPS